MVGGPCGENAERRKVRQSVSKHPTNTFIDVDGSPRHLLLRTSGLRTRSLVDARNFRPCIEGGVIVALPPGVGT